MVDLASTVMGKSKPHGSGAGRGAMGRGGRGGFDMFVRFGW
jgi:hypothetical protein